MTITFLSLHCSPAGQMCPSHSVVAGSRQAKPSPWTRLLSSNFVENGQTLFASFRMQLSSNFRWRLL